MLYAISNRVSFIGLYFIINAVYHFNKNWLIRNGIQTFIIKYKQTKTDWLEMVYRHVL
jgi:hypothetical protein